MADKLRPRKEGKQVMLILGDGADHFSHHSFDELSKRLRSVNLPLYAVLLESDWEPFWTYSDIWRYPRSRRRYPGPFDPTRLEIASLEDIAQRSGGDTYTPQFLSSAALYDTCREIAAEIESQYMLGFYSEKADGKWHKIKVSVRSADGKKLKVSHRKGYQATQRN
jgi:VWFA-related protein